MTKHTMTTDEAIRVAIAAAQQSGKVITVPEIFKTVQELTGSKYVRAFRYSRKVKGYIPIAEFIEEKLRDAGFGEVNATVIPFPR